MNYAQTGELVKKALAGNYGIWVRLDAGDFDLFGDDLRDEWESLAPGEAFSVLGLLTGEGSKQ